MCSNNCLILGWLNQVGVMVQAFTTIWFTLLAKFASNICIKNPIVCISMHLRKLPIMFSMYSHVNFNALLKKKSNKAWVVGWIDEK
jgi:uncharacterized membrane protein